MDSLNPVIVTNAKFSLFFVTSSLRRLLRVLCPVTCVLLVLVQACFLDYYLVFYNDSTWCSWAVADSVVAGLITGSLVLSNRYWCSASGCRGCAEDGRRVVDKRSPSYATCELVFSLAWLLFAVIISAKIGILFGVDRYIVAQLKLESTLNGSVLRTVLCSSGIIVFLLIVSHRDALAVVERNADSSEADCVSDRSDFMKALSSTVALDLIDSVQFLDVLYLYESRVILSYELQTAVVAFTCINFIVPTALLLALLIRSDSWLRRLPYLRQVIYVLIVNVPMFVIRCIIWHYHLKEVSVFIVKNVLEVGKAIYDVFEIHEKNTIFKAAAAARAAGERGGQQHGENALRHRGLEMYITNSTAAVT